MTRPIQLKVEPETDRSQKSLVCSLSSVLCPRCCLAVLVIVVLAGCAKAPFLGQMMTPSYQPSNVFREEAVLPSTIRRVAILPMSSLTEEADMGFGRDALGPVLLNELNRVRQFELVSISTEELRLLSGRSVWSAEEKLPADFFDRIKEKYGVDAILFSRLTQYQAYEPLAIGWRLKLIDAEEPHVLWAVDEVFDSRVPSVAAAAVRFAEDNPDTGASLSDSRSVLLSARRFGHYTAHAVVQTMPGRTESVR